MAVCCVSVRALPNYTPRGIGFDSRRYQIFLVVGLERSLLSLVRINEELLESNSSDSGLEGRD
jgi:hypothetical protein